MDFGFLSDIPVYVIFDDASTQEQEEPNAGKTAKK